MDMKIQKECFPSLPKTNPCGESKLQVMSERRKKKKDTSPAFIQGIFIVPAMEKYALPSWKRQMSFSQFSTSASLTVWKNSSSGTIAFRIHLNFFNASWSSFADVNRHDYDQSSFYRVLNLETEKGLWRHLPLVVENGLNATIKLD
ncbi:hypothetical protein TNCV_5135241 [Trichonephila clavipes]|nr:hypothetical protein TNCV_5135241 [Trichonephila clavipes]